ncbi:MAG: PadR family transcriptional regulator [Dehalococcoidales bacterium]|nr:PadR family transcriptional regulator [Dehalococcoidales bacterium]
MRNKEILSQTSLMILGIIAEKPAYPYAINKIINYRSRYFQSKLPRLSVYGTINLLKKKKMIAGRRVKDSNMPEKTIYHITPKGRSTLITNMASFLSTPEEPLSNMGAALLMLGHLDKDTAVNALNELKTKLEKEIAQRKLFISKEKVNQSSYAGLIAVKRALDVLKVDLATVESVLAKAESDSEWNLFPIPFWRSEVGLKENPESDKPDG